MLETAPALGQRLGEKTKLKLSFLIRVFGVALYRVPLHRAHTCDLLSKVTRVR